MKSKTLIPVFAACALAVFFAGCGKTEEPAPPAAATPRAADQASQSLKQTADAVAQQAATASEAAKKAAAQVSEQVSAATAQAQSLIDQLKKLISENKLTEAGDLLNKLTQIKLTPEQQAIVDNLKQQIQKMAKSATEQGSKALDSLVKPQK
jgi:hypothetical protein